MFLSSLIEELCTKEENNESGCTLTFGGQCIYKFKILKSPDIKYAFGKSSGITSDFCNSDIVLTKWHPDIAPILNRSNVALENIVSGVRVHCNKSVGTRAALYKVPGFFKIPTSPRLQGLFFYLSKKRLPSRNHSSPERSDLWVLTVLLLEKI